MEDVAASLCKCLICHMEEEDKTDQNFDTLVASVEPQYSSHHIVGCLKYSIDIHQPLHGVPLCKGSLWRLTTTHSQSKPLVQIEPVTLTLFMNGFVVTVEGQTEESVVLSPFVIVRNAKLQGADNDNFRGYKIFRVSLFTMGISYCFAAFSHDTEQADEERSQWVTAFAKTIRRLTRSLFPQFHISCKPLEAVAETSGRLMAGYLIHQENMCHVSVLYCELHPQHEDCRDQAKLVLYENELCQTIVTSIFITVNTVSCEKFGISCSCFSVEDHEFSALSLSEKKLWLRAISNIQVKLENAPTPTRNDLHIYRMAIKEQLNSPTWGGQNDVRIEPLLQPYMTWDLFNFENRSVVDSIQTNESNFDQEVEDMHAIMLFQQTPEVPINDFPLHEDESAAFKLPTGLLTV